MFSSNCADMDVLAALVVVSVVLYGADVWMFGCLDSNATDRLVYFSTRRWNNSGYTPVPVSRAMLMLACLR